MSCRSTERDVESLEVEYRMNRIAIVLAGGRSSRLGRDKASLLLRGETLLDRVVAAAEAVAPGVEETGPAEAGARKAGAVEAGARKAGALETREVGACLVVTAPGTTPPIRSKRARVVSDPVGSPHGGPLVGFATGLAAAPSEARIALLLATDHPFLEPALLRFLCERLEAMPQIDCVIPYALEHDHPLVAAYRTAVRPIVLECLARGERSMRALVEHLRVDSPTEDELRRVDPSLRSFLDIDTEQDLSRALEFDDPRARSS